MSQNVNSEPCYMKMITHRYNMWIERMREKNQSITDYFNITPPKGSDERLHIDITPSRSMRYFIMTLYYTTKPKYRLLEFTEEINQLFYEYYREDFIFQFKIDVSEYPFKPTRWSLYSFNYRFSTEYEKEFTNGVVESYCKSVLRCHNCQNTSEWSPAIMLSNDVLTFYTLINNFRVLVNKLKRKNLFKPVDVFLVNYKSIEYYGEV